MRAPTSWRIICAASGSAPRVVVGLCVERSLEMVVGLLGILKAGGAYLPLDPDYPAERLAFMLADAGAPVLVTQAALRDRLPRARRAMHRAARCRLARHRAKPATAPPSGLGRDNTAYVIYTSGSTGTPKGVDGHARERACDCFAATMRSLRFRRRRCCCTMFHSFAFDFSVWEILGRARCTAAALVVVPERERASPTPFDADLRRERRHRRSTRCPRLLPADAG